MDTCLVKWGWNYLSILWLKLNHVSKRSHGYPERISSLHWVNSNNPFVNLRMGFPLEQICIMRSHRLCLFSSRVRRTTKEISRLNFSGPLWSEWTAPYKGTVVLNRFHDMTSYSAASRHMRPRFSVFGAVRILEAIRIFKNLIYGQCILSTTSIRKLRHKVRNRNPSMKMVSIRWAWLQM